jgi:hypothetical protein
MKHKPDLGRMVFESGLNLKPNLSDPWGCKATAGEFETLITATGGVQGHL